MSLKYLFILMYLMCFNVRQTTEMKHASAHLSAFSLKNLVKLQNTIRRKILDRIANIQRKCDQNTRNYMKTNKITYFYNRINGFICRAAQLLLVPSPLPVIYQATFYLSFNLIILRPLLHQAR